MAVQHRFSERADGDFAITAEPRALAAPVGDLAKACKACHDDFRKKD